jgi:molybdopterin-containing oxidoreductase family membrane subunit
MSAIMAPRFLASAFAAGPSLLIIICLILRKVADYDVGQEAIEKLAEIVTYAMIANVFFVALELFTALYSDMPHHVHHFQYLFFGLDGGTKLVPWMWLSVVLAGVSLAILLFPRYRQNPQMLAIGCGAVFFSLWIDKGLGMVITGFIPNPVGRVVEYWPTLPEAMIALAIWAMGFFIITVLYKIAITMRKAEA